MVLMSDMSRPFVFSPRKPVRRALVNFSNSSGYRAYGIPMLVSVARRRAWSPWHTRLTVSWPSSGFNKGLSEAPQVRKASKFLSHAKQLGYALAEPAADFCNSHAHPESARLT